MKISSEMQTKITEEIDYVVKRMKESPSPQEKLYFFSAIFGVIQRIFNLEFDPELVYLHFVLRHTYQSFQDRVNAITKAGDSTIPLTDIQFEKLTSFTEDLNKKIKEKKSLDGLLKDFVLLSYTTTGNGYYLFQKGLLRL
jgi:hypothetical protein